VRFLLADGRVSGSAVHEHEESAQLHTVTSSQRLTR